MMRVGSLVVLTLGFVVALSAADSIIIDKKVYKGVKIVESAARYYIKIDEGGQIKTLSVSKNDIKPEEMSFGDGPTPWEEAAASRGEPVTAGASRIELQPAPLEGTPPLEADALVLKAGGGVVAFCTVDAAALDHLMLDAVAKALGEAGSAIGRGNLMLSATHTQSGTCLGVLQGAVQEAAFGPFKEQRVAGVAGELAKAILEAEQKAEPAQLRFGAVQEPRFSVNRNESSKLEDATLAVMAVETAGGKPLAYLINYAAHPSILAEETLAALRKEPVYARDYPGGLAEGLRDAAKAPGLPVLFVNGAEADVAPNPPEADTPAEKAKAMGQALAEAALAALDDAMPQPSAEIAIHSQDAPMPRSILAELLPATAVLTDVRINDALFLSLPGEVSSSLGASLREQAEVKKGAKQVFLCGLTNDYAGYYTSAEAFFGENIEAQLSFFGPLAGRWLFENYALAEGGDTAYCPMLTKAQPAYQAGLEKGKAQKQAIQEAWDKLVFKLTTLAPMLKGLKEVPAEAKALMATVQNEQLVYLAVQFLSVFGRQQFADWSDEKRVTLMGAADGAEQPFDAIFVLQFIATPSGLPEEATKALPALDIKGIDFLGS
jgi:hypothetical protein